jgi:hypothetical protein
VPLRASDLPGKITGSQASSYNSHLMNYNSHKMIKDRSVDILRESGIAESIIDEDINRDLENLDDHQSSIGMSGSISFAPGKPTDSGSGGKSLGLGKKFLQLKAAETVKAKKRYSEQNTD